MTLPSMPRATCTSATLSQVTPAGAVSTYVSTGLSSPEGLAFDSAGNLFAVSFGTNTILKIAPVPPTASVPLSNVTVFHFTDANPNATPADFTATVRTG